MEDISERYREWQETNLGKRDESLVKEHKHCRRVVLMPSLRICIHEVMKVQRSHSIIEYVIQLKF